MPVIVPSSSTPTNNSPPSAFANATSVSAMSLQTDLTSRGLGGLTERSRALLNSLKWLSPRLIPVRRRSVTLRAEIRGKVTRRTSKGDDERRHSTEFEQKEEVARSRGRDHRQQILRPVPQVQCRPPN